MKQGIVAAPSGHLLRLLLIFFGAVFGLLVLSFVFGSSSATAAESDDSPDDLGGQLGGIVSTATDPVQQVLAPAVSTPTAAPVAAIVSPITATVDSTLTTLVGTGVLGSTPVTSVVDPVVGVVDTALVDVTTAVAPVIHTFDLAGALGAAAPPPAAAASGVALALDGIGGIAGGTLDLGTLSPAGTDPSNAGTAPAGLGLLATTLGAGFAALLLVRRQRLAPIEMPGSPVYATDTSPD